MPQPTPPSKSHNQDETSSTRIDLPTDFAEPKPLVPPGPEPHVSGPHVSGPQSAAAVKDGRLRLRTTAMWTVAALIVVGALLMILVTPKVGVFYLAGLLIIAGILRIFLPGTPFGLSARTKIYDSTFCFAVALAMIILTNSASALR